MIFCVMMCFDEVFLSYSYWSGRGREWRLILQSARASFVCRQSLPHADREMTGLGC
jgi:hypothetical protein